MFNIFRRRINRRLNEDARKLIENCSNKITLEELNRKVEELDKPVALEIV